MSSLSQEEIKALEDDRVLLSGPVNGKRKVSAALLTPPSTQGSLSSGSTSSASVRVRAFNHSQAPFDLPESDESVAAVEWCGFTRTKAGEIYSRWLSRPNPQQNPDGLLEYMIGEINRLNMQPWNQAPIEQAMTALGVSDELQSVLTSPVYRQIFLSETLHYWLTDTIRDRYGSLKILQRKLKFRGANTVARRKGGKRAKVIDVFDQTASTQASSSSSLPSQSQLSGSAISSIQSDALPAAYVSVDSPPSILPGHIVLYKGKSSVELLSERFIREDGSINMGSIESMKGGDFNQRRGAWYFSREEATAEQYRQWAAARNHTAETWIIRVQIPKDFIDGLRRKDLWYSPDWKTYVWYCRKGTSEGNPPAKFDVFWKPGQAQLIEGHICGRSPNIIPKIPKQDVQQRMSESDLLYNGNRKATQCVFVDEEAVERLGELIRGKIFIEIFPALQSSDFS
ncbi:hypothetical protein BKA64DRAFT_595504 [Cadophora sp. MPI-SDFR-AT-0126]|nr:hypothetical protein BKA64DRAFT_595504 [Leotiomycetes sp. MPI-SDFR-AT-0126]